MTTFQLHSVNLIETVSQGYKESLAQFDKLSMIVQSHLIFPVKCVEGGGCPDLLVLHDHLLPSLEHEVTLCRVRRQMGK